jgi:O-antigen biosynthesis protein
VADTAFIIIERANSIYSMGQCDQAVALLAEALEENPRQPELTSRIAEFLIDSGEHSTALKFLQGSEDDEPENDRLRLKGICLEALGDAASAGAIADRMLLIEGQRAHALVIRARVAMRSGDSNLAQGFLEDAIALESTCGLAWFGLGILLRERNCAIESLSCFEKALSASPNSREILLSFHETALSTGSLQRAETYLRQILGRQSINRRLRFVLIDVLLRQGKVDEAMTEIESALVDFGIDDGLLNAALSVRQQVGGQRIIEGSETGSTVSLCMIVKNEEKDLARCLRSAKPVVHEMVIVDTGSSDRTRQIATVFGARVLDFEWTDDFSKARNVSLAQATGNWILILDADEVLSPDTHDAFRSLVRGRPTQPVAYSIRTRNYTHNPNTIGWIANRNEFPEEEGSGWFPSDKVRLFPNDARIIFANSVHELVEPSLIEAGVKIKSCPAIPIHHFGHLQEVKTTDKNRAYFDLGLKKLKKNRRNLSALKELAIQSAHVGNHEEALRLWKEFSTLQPNSAEAFLNLGSACWNLRRYPEAVQWAEKALHLEPFIKEGLFNKAVAFLMMGRARESKTILRGLLEKMPNYPPAQFMFCVACACSGETREGEKVFQTLQAMSVGPHLRESFLDVAKRMVSESQMEYARRTIEAALGYSCDSEELHALLNACSAAA